MVSLSTASSVDLTASSRGVKKPAGSVNSIDLPYITISDIGPTIGKKLAQGGFGTIYAVRDSDPMRVYKIIFTGQFKNGDEIRITEIAGKLGVGPAFHGAYLVQQPENAFVAVEMDHAGHSLGCWSEELAEKEEASEKLEESEPLSDKEQAMQEMMEKMKTEMEASCGFKVISSREVRRVSLEEVLEALDKTPEEFYIELFSTIQLLAANKIAYLDTNWGNIIPKSRLTGRVQLIDFDQALLMKTPEAAAAKAVRSAYNWSHFRDFTKLQNLSPKSLELISWVLKHSQ